MSRFVEVRRHAYTKKGDARGRGSHLSKEGVRLARELGSSIGPFACVAASDVPRTLETALAMGFSVDEIIPFPAESQWEAVIEEMGWHVLWEVEQPFAYVARVLPTLPQTKQMASHYAEQWRKIAHTLGDDECALIVTHGLISEAGIVACLPDADHASWGPPFSHCEGARLELRDGAFVGIEFLRVEAQAYT